MATIPTRSEATSFPAITLFARGESGAVSIPSSAHTLDGFRQWALSEAFPERGQFSFVGGELIIDMSPEFFETHNAIKTEVTTVVYERVKRLRVGRVFGDRYLLSNEAADISTEPDAMFVTHSSFRSGRCQILNSTRPGVAQELVGSPDWVLEIVSVSSQRKDKQLLRDAYVRAGVGEYWLIDALGDGIDFQMLVPVAGGYAAVEPCEGWLASPTFGCSFRLTREKDEDGLWQYTLHTQEES